MNEHKLKISNKKIDDLVKNSQIIYINLYNNLESLNKQCKELLEKWYKHYNVYTEIKQYNDVFINNANYINYEVGTHSIAILTIPDNIDMYSKKIGSKTRNMIRKSEKNNYSCKIFNWNDYLDDIYEINISKSFRQNQEMTEGYKLYPSTISESYMKSLSNSYNIIFYGCFLENKLVAYIWIVIINDIMVFNRIIGHGDHLKYGIMNHLIYFIVDNIINTKEVKYINYTDWGCQPGLKKFKISVGFEEKLVLFKKRE